MNLNLFKLFRILFVLLVISLSFVGSDCEKTIQNIGGGNGDITGKWQLVYNVGTLNDICPGETVDFQSNGVAVLFCPGNNQTINRNYTVSGTTLTYTETGVRYKITTPSSTELQLEGLNVQRLLDYSKITTDEKTMSNSQSTINNNSSER